MIHIQEVQDTPAPLGHWSEQARPHPTFAVASTLSLWPLDMDSEPIRKEEQGSLPALRCTNPEAEDAPPSGSRAACCAAVSGHIPPPSIYRTGTPDLTKKNFKYTKDFFVPSSGYDRLEQDTQVSWASLVAQTVTNLPEMQEN